MSDTLNPLRAVFSLPPKDVDPAAFEAVLARELDALLQVDGVASARLYTLQPSVGAGTASPAVYRYCGLYELEGDHDTVLARLDATALDAEEPEFLARTRRAVYDLTAIDEINAAHTLDAETLYIVFGRPPAEISAEDFDAWYVKHVRENVKIGEMASAHRWDTLASLVDPLLPPHATHVATYELTAGKDAMNALLNAAIADGRIVLPEWFPQITFASAQLTAITDRQRAA